MRVRSGRGRLVGRSVACRSTDMGEEQVGAVGRSVAYRSIDTGKGRSDGTWTGPLGKGRGEWSGATRGSGWSEDQGWWPNRRY